MPTIRLLYRTYHCHCHCHSYRLASPSLYWTFPETISARICRFHSNSIDICLSERHGKSSNQIHTCRRLHERKLTFIVNVYRVGHNVVIDRHIIVIDVVHVESVDGECCRHQFRWCRRWIWDWNDVIVTTRCRNIQLENIKIIIRDDKIKWMQSLQWQMRH